MSSTSNPAGRLNLQSLNHLTTAPRLAFFTSLALSFIAFQFSPILARDSALYIHMANLYNQYGYAGIEGQFDWPWLSVMIGWMHSLTGLSMISSGNVLMALFLAGACAVMTKTTATIAPKAAAWGAVVALTLPAFNGYRDVILREPGFWFFASLATYFMVLWAQNRQHRQLCFAVCAILSASAFRLEAVSMLAAMGLTIIWGQRGWLRTHWRLSSLSVVVSALCLLALVLWLINYPEQLGDRAARYLNLVDPRSIIHSFNATTEVFAAAVLEKYSHEHAGIILFTGFAMTIIFKSALMLGPFILVFLVKYWVPLRSRIPTEATFIITSAGIHFAVLMIFFVQHGFTIPRYISFLHVLTVPLIAVLAHQLAIHSKRAGMVLGVLAVLSGIDNVVSLSEKRTHYFAAAEWIQTHLPEDAKIYFDDRRIAFYARRAYLEAPSPLESLLHTSTESYEYLVLEERSTSQAISNLIRSGETKVLAVFDNGGTRHITILGKKPPAADP